MAIVRNASALALGLLVVGLGLYGAVVVTPLAYPAAFTAAGATSNVVALFVMFSIIEVFTMFAGWITARLVADRRRAVAIRMAVVGVALAMGAGVLRWSAAPAWYYVASWVLMPAAAAVGVAAWERTLRRPTAPGTSFPLL
jgi:hypothetical protein